MRIAGIDFPKTLLNALRDGELIVFAGAGVSMGEPANLRSFKSLASAIGHGTGEELQDHEQEDSYLGRLQHRNGVHVHELAAQELAKGDPEPTSLHHDLLRLYPDSHAVRVVTTNFDLLFEKAARTEFDSEPEVFKAPALPLGRSFSGIVHIHGAVSRPSEMVLTDADFGRAYLTEGWAPRFLVDLFRSFTVLFVGYSHNDTDMRYLARGLPASDTKPRFALIENGDKRLWTALNIKPITYPRSPDDGHDSLYNGVCHLAAYARRGILDWKRELAEVAQKPPILDEEEIDIVEEAITNPKLTRFFTQSATHHDWIDWLDKRKHFDRLFGTGDIQPQDKELARWLADKFTISHPSKILLLIASHEMRLHANLWWALSHTVAQNHDHPMDADNLSRWVSILLATATPSPDHQYRLSNISERCMEAGLIDSIIDIFDFMTSNGLVLKRGVDWPHIATDDSNPPIDVKVTTGDDHYMLDTLWKSGLQPNLDTVAEPLLGRVVHRLGVQHQAYRAWQKSGRNWDRTSYGRSAIEPHTQNRHPTATDVLIDAARDCLEWLVSNHPDAAAGWCHRLVRSQASILRRLAVHALQHRTDLTADEKVDWLLRRIGLHEHAAHHETYQALRIIYPDASVKQRKAVINAVHTYRWFDPQDEDYERRNASNHFRWLDCLHKADPDCAVAKQALNAVLQQYPDLSLGYHPDFLHWIGEPKMVTPESPWSPEELVSKDPQDWLEELLSFQQTDFEGPSREDLLQAIEQAANLKFAWGLDLAYTLAAEGHWHVDIWLPLMRAWRNELDESKHRSVLSRLTQPELYPKHTRLSVDLLHALVQQDGVPYAAALLPEANRLARYLWGQIDLDEELFEREDWSNRSITPADTLTLFWIGSLSVWMNQQDPKPKTISNEYREALSTVVQDRTLAGRLGRTVLAWHFSLLLSYDREWVKEHLLPPLEQRDNDEDYQAFWDGLTSGRLTPAAAEVLNSAFLNALPHIKTIFSGEERLRSFIGTYTAMLVYFVNDPLIEWIPKFFKNANSNSRSYFAGQIGYFLGNIDDTKQRELWTRWLRRYWENRLHGVPAQLTDEEMVEMIAWTPRFSSLFPDAVELATKMPNSKAKYERPLWMSLHRIQKKRIWRSHPESTAALLLYLKPLTLSYYSPGKIKKLIDNLRKMNLPPETDRALDELSIGLP